MPGRRLPLSVIFRAGIAVAAVSLPGSGYLVSAQTPPSAQTASLKVTAQGDSPELLATYEAWFGHHGHIPISYSSDDKKTLRAQIDRAKSMGISGFVVDWYGDRNHYIDHNYGLMQKLAAKANFKVAMMYDQSGVRSTEEVIADLTMFRDTYLQAHSSGHDAYLTLDDRPVIFIFPAGIQTDWDRVRAAINQWDPAPLLITENLPNKYMNDFDGFYPWINPGPKGWSPDGSDWGQDYLATYYQRAVKKANDKIIVGGAWSSFNDSRASWGRNRHIDARCGQTLHDTMTLWRRYVPAGQVIPFLMLETWNDYEEGSAIEAGLPVCH